MKLNREKTKNKNNNNNKNKIDGSNKLIFEKSQKGQKAYSLPREDSIFSSFQPPLDCIREDLVLFPEMSELDLLLHFSQLAQKNMCIDTHFYPLGSCTMKLNPKINEWAAQLSAFQDSHPLAPDDFVQGNLQIMEELLEKLCKIAGMDAGSLAPNAGAQGEFVGMKMIARYHQAHEFDGGVKREEVLIPDNAHGTNPATATMLGFKIIVVETAPDGDIDMGDLKSKVSDKTAALMLTNPNTLGLFSSKILEITSIIHSYGALLYYDGANLNAILNIVRPGDMGFDVMHINLHKTFSTPHGGGGPGSGPVLCKKILEPYLPFPRVFKGESGYQTLWKEKRKEKEEGKEGGKSLENKTFLIASFLGNFSICLRAYLYIYLLGNYGLRRTSEVAVLNANYLKTRLATYLNVPYPQHCMHEFIIQLDEFLDKGVKAWDVAKRLLDYGVHAPTTYFPLMIKECFLVEPTETESKKTLDDFVEILKKILKEIKNEPSLLTKTPFNMSTYHLDELYAAKNPVLIWENK